MTEKEILEHLNKLRGEYCHEGAHIVEYLNGVVRAVFETTAKVLKEGK